MSTQADLDERQDDIGDDPLRSTRGASGGARTTGSGGIALFGLMLTAVVLIVSAVVGTGTVLAAHLLASWTGLPAAHLLAAILSVAALFVIVLVITATTGDIKDSITHLTDTCAELGHAFSARRLQWLLADNAEEVQLQTSASAKRGRGRRR
jgi:hypothetical protein